MKQPADITCMVVFVGACLVGMAVFLVFTILGILAWALVSYWTWLWRMLDA